MQSRERTSTMQMLQSGQCHSRRDGALGLGAFRLSGSNSSCNTCKVFRRQRTRSLGVKSEWDAQGMLGQSRARLALKTSL